MAESSANLNRHFDNPIGTDVRILCDEKFFNVHGEVIFYRSRLLELLCRQSDQEVIEFGCFILKDVDRKTLRVVLQGLYSEEIVLPRRLSITCFSGQEIIKQHFVLLEEVALLARRIEATQLDIPIARHLVAGIERCVLSNISFDLSTVTTIYEGLSDHSARFDIEQTLGGWKNKRVGDFMNAITKTAADLEGLGQSGPLMTQLFKNLADNTIKVDCSNTCGAFLMIAISEDTAEWGWATGSVLPCPNKSCGAAIRIGFEIEQRIRRMNA